MGIYCGVNGTVRRAEADSRDYFGIRHIRRVEAGVDGVIRSFSDILDEIDHVEICFDDCYTYDIEKNEDGSFSMVNRLYGLSEVSRVGSVLIGTNSIFVETTKAKKEIDVRGTVFPVFRDGHKGGLSPVVETDGFGSSFSVGYSVSTSGHGYYAYSNDFCGGIIDLSGAPKSGTSIISGASNSAIFIDCGIAEGMSRVTMQFTFNSFSIGGKSLQIAVLNELPN